MAKGRPRDPESDGDDLEVIELLTDERTSTARGPEPEAGDEDRPPRRRRLLVLVLAIVAVVAALAGVSIVVSRDDGDAEAGPANRSTSNASGAAPAANRSTSSTSRTALDAVPGSTAISPWERPPATIPGNAFTTAPLLPEGAPSTPHIGELVASVANPDGVLFYLYADGRLIWSSGQADGGGGLVEQRLTPEGVERVRSEFLAAGLTPDVPPRSDEECWGGGACVRADDGRLHRLFLPAPRGEVSAAEARLVSYLTTLDSSLPETEWAARRIRTYVASRFNVCVGTYADLPPDRAILVQIDLSAVLPAFPTGAAELFGSREAHHGGPGPSPYCFETTLEEARALADVFLSPTGGGTHEYSGIVIRNAELATIPSDVSEGIIAHVNFQPLLPNGMWAGPYVG